MCFINITRTSLYQQKKPFALKVEQKSYSLAFFADPDDIVAFELQKETKRGSVDVIKKNRRIFAISKVRIETSPDTGKPVSVPNSSKIEGIVQNLVETPLPVASRKGA